MKTKKHPRELSDTEAQTIVDAFDDRTGAEFQVVLSDTLAELRSAAAAQRDADGRIEAATRAARRAGASWGVIGAQLGITRQGARQRFERLTD